MNDSLTHTGSDKLSKDDILDKFNSISDRISKEFHSDQEKAAKLLLLLDELIDFELGRFFIKHDGALSGYWTYYIILGFNNTKVTNKLESFLLNKSPGVLATQERFHIFQELLHKNIKQNSVVCSIPCGVMADLLTLDLPEEISDVRFVGIDLDTAAFDLAKDFAKQKGILHQCEFFQKDAWELGDENEYDIITSNGLNLYEKDDDRVTPLYRVFHKALKPGGKFIGSHLSCPPTSGDKSEWDLSKIDMEALEVQKSLFMNILQATWANYRPSSQTKAQLEEANFEDIQFYWDKARMFYTFEATKPLL